MDKRTLQLMTSGKSTEWYTPLDLYNRLNNRYHFTTDPCAESTNRLNCDVFYTQETDGLNHIDKWKGNVFVNPPYGKSTILWIQACITYVKQTDNIAVMLLPARTDTKWFHEYFYKKPGIEIEFIKGRLNFSPDSGYRKSETSNRFTAPFPSMIVTITNKGET